MKQLQQWLDEAKANGTKKVFISFHAPAFCRAGMDPIPEAQNPHKVIAAYAKDLDIVVFNGHVHTTELYNVDGVKYLVLGGVRMLCGRPPRARRPQYSEPRLRQNSCETESECVPRCAGRPYSIPTEIDVPETYTTVQVIAS
jgi:hypothetical protein